MTRRGGEWTFVQRSTVAGGVEAVWHRVTSPEGINDEMRPWLTMSMPRGAEALRIDTLPLGEPIGRAWVRLFGVVPVDHDHLTITDLEQGRRFREESTMLSMRRWVHERTLTPAPGGGTDVEDRIVLVPRIALRWAGPVLRTVLAAFFRHRHHRLARHFAG
ncbi:hypothetical protein WCD74_26140 [Actinomycetospora sp. OC33-EN08]|uniref:Ligand-binding SRPBCC domain-containing protein n=1 Tax=Actinomycetospora aurantiaca TaxID=3129233 RepID=A0ABU8MWI4_9PSEU